MSDSNKFEKNQEHQKKVQQEHEKKQKEAEKTLHELVQEVENNPDNYHPYYNLGTFLVKMQNYNQAEELFMKSLGRFAKSDQDTKDTLTYGLGNVYYTAGDFDKSIKQFNQIKDRSLKVDSYIMIAQSYMAKKDYKKAIVFALTAQGFQRQNAEINRLLGANLLAIGDFKTAAQFYDKALESNSNDGNANFNRGIIAMVQGEEFSDYFDKAKKYDKDYFDKGQKRLADIERFIQVQRKKPNNNN